jgi:hypothetical protein
VPNPITQPILSAEDILINHLGNDVHGLTTEKSKGAISGYAIGDPNLVGKVLINASWGYDLVVRLKDTRPMLAEEIYFWSALLSRLDLPFFEIVTAAPSSGKVPAHEHLATILGSMVSWHCSKPFRQLLWSPLMRKTKAGRKTKLDERVDSLFYYGPKTGCPVLVVDDAIYTRSTLLRCRAAIRDGGDFPIFATLYRG